jgi:hypothetical protein
VNHLITVKGALMRLIANSASIVKHNRHGQQHAKGAVMIQSKMPMSVSIKETSMKGNPSRNPRGLQSSLHILLPLVVVVVAQVD